MRDDVYLKKNFLSKADFNLIKGWVSNNYVGKIRGRHKVELSKVKEINNPLKILFLKVIKDLINESDKNITFEWWINFNAKQNWHIDKDEDAYITDQIFVSPYRSIIFYVKKPQEGGEIELIRTLASEKKMLFEKYDCLENQILSFNSSIPHRVCSYDGQRISIAINIWKQISCWHSTHPC